MGPVNGFSVDVEDYFQVQAFARVIGRDSWDRIPSRVEANTERMLDLCAEAGVKGTFFTLGWVADRFPGIVRRIVEEGHELASHGYGHALVTSLTPEEFRADLHRAKTVLEDVGGVQVTGYRAPTFSIGPRTPWAFDLLEETGHRYSSSLYPVLHDLYGAPDAPRVPYRPGAGSLVEIPMTTVVLGGRNCPVSGGGYFRLMPYVLYRALLRRFHRQDGRASVFYTHPWEIDPGQPRITEAPLLSRFRHGVNLHRTAGRIARLLRDFQWDRMDKVFAADLVRLAG